MDNYQSWIHVNSETNVPAIGCVVTVVLVPEHILGLPPSCVQVVGVGVAIVVHVRISYIYSTATLIIRCSDILLILFVRRWRWWWWCLFLDCRGRCLVWVRVWVIISCSRLLLSCCGLPVYLFAFTCTTPHSIVILIIIHLSNIDFIFTSHLYSPLLIDDCLGKDEHRIWGIVLKIWG